MSLLRHFPGDFLEEDGFAANRFTQSALFDGSTGKLEKTWSGMQAQDSQQWTFSCLLKLGNPQAGDSHILYRMIDADGHCSIHHSNGAFSLLHRDNSTNFTRFYSPYAFQDPAAWYHLVVVLDTPNAVEADRIRMYVNGVRVLPDGYTAPTLNGSIPLGQDGSYAIGHSPSYGQWWTGYLAELHFVPQQTLEPEAFGSFDAQTGLWVPDKVASPDTTGRGFYLAAPFGSEGGWIKSGTITASQDTASNNHCVINRLNETTSSTYSDGNLRVLSNADAGDNQWFGTLPISDGKYHFEVLVQGSGTAAHGYGIGIASSLSGKVNHGSIAFGQIYYDSGSGQIHDASDGALTSTAYGATYQNGDRIAVEIDFPANKVRFYKNGVSQGDYTPKTPILGRAYFPAAGDRTSAASIGYKFVFEAGGFLDAPSADFLPICTANMPAVQIHARDYITDGKVSTTGAAVKVTGVGFQPDLLLWKDSGASSSLHWVTEPGKALFSDNTLGESVLADGVLSFDEDGFTLGTHAGYTANGKTFWFMALKKGPHFEFSKYTGDGVFGRGIPHGLDGPPQLVLVKRLNAADSWMVGGTAIGGTNYMVLNANSPAAAATYFADTNPDNTNVYVANFQQLNQAGGEYIMFAFRTAPGLLMINRRDAAGAAQHSYTGGTPLVEIIKLITAAGDWFLFPDSMNNTGPKKNKIDVNGTAAFAVGTGVSHDANANGISIPAADSGQINANNTHDYLDILFLRGPMGGRNLPPALGGGIARPSQIVATVT